MLKQELQEFDNVKDYIEYIELRDKPQKVFCRERTSQLKIRKNYKYNTAREKQIARRIMRLVREINRKKGTAYPINKYEHYKMRINWLNSQIGWKYNNEFERRE